MEGREIEKNLDLAWRAFPLYAQIRRAGAEICLTLLCNPRVGLKYLNLGLELDPNSLDMKEGIKFYSRVAGMEKR